MPVSKDYQAYVEELLAPLGAVVAKRMFGGVGMFCRERMFALIADDVLYFKTNDSNRPAFEAADSGPFEYETRNGTRGVMAYWRVPDEVLENEDEIVAWGRRAIDVALAGAAKAQKQARGRKAGR
jgi:DNA transformation protein